MTLYRPVFIAQYLLGITLLSISMIAHAETRMAQPATLNLTVTFNNVSYRPGLQTSWGFSCLVEGLDRTLLFDTGGDGNVLLANMDRLNIDPGSVNAVFISHMHGDHTGGLDRLLSRNADVDVYLPDSASTDFEQAVATRGARVHSIKTAGQLFSHAYSSGELGTAPKEQSLVVETPKGLVVITGCAHPNIVNIVRKVKRQRNKEVYLLMGGFHLLGMDREQLQGIVDDLKQEGVARVAPSHCTGDAAIAMFRQEWGKNFVEGGLGAVIKIPLKESP